VRACVWLSVFGSLEFFLLPLPLPLFVLVLPFLLVSGWLCLALLVSGSRRRPTGIGRVGFLYFSSIEMFWPTPLYKASMHIVRAFFFTQQFTIHSSWRSGRGHFEVSMEIRMWSQRRAGALLVLPPQQIISLPLDSQVIAL
jgi:hypothetical protein